MHFGSGPLLLVAGAGTGKTRVITERIAYLIKKKKVRPEEILALTFTEKAAGEMLNRVDEVMPLSYAEPYLSTFHSFAERLLRDESLEIGLDPAYKIMTPTDAWLFFRRHLFEFPLDYYRPLGTPSKFVSAILTFFSRLQDEDIASTDFNGWVNGRGDFLKRSLLSRKGETFEGESDQLEKEKWEELAAAYEKYQSLKIAESRLDFGDLIAWTLRLFRERPNILAKYRKQFRYVLVDEFQDTNFAQYQLIKLLAPAAAKPNLLVCADDDQAIYRFRGASVSNVLEFKKDYPRSKVIILTKNYRSLPPILKASYRLIQNNNPDRLEVKLKISKNLRPQRKEKFRGKYRPPVIEIQFSENGEREVFSTVEKIISLTTKTKTNPNPRRFKDIAIMARANSHLDPLALALKEAEIPYQRLGNRGLFDQPEIRLLLAFLRLLVNPEDSASLYFLLSSAFGLSPNTLSDLLKEARSKRCSLWSVLPVDNELKKLILSLQQMIPEKSGSQLLYQFVIKSGLLKPYLAAETIENGLKIKNINLFFEKVKRFEAEDKAETLYDLVELLNGVIEAGENPAQAEIEDIDTVNLLTVHAAKGLEFPVVFLVNLVSDRFPTRERGETLPIPDDLVKETLPEGDAHLEEERRLFYVGVTRARDRLILTAAKNYGGVREKKLSGFVGELGLKIPEVVGGERADLLSPTPSAARAERLRPLAKIEQVSYSQLETFAQCPLKYKYRYLIGLIGEPSHVLSFGQTIHRVLRDFHRPELFQEKSDLSDLLKLYRQHWLNEGYDNKEHREQRFSAGEKILTDYFNDHGQKLGRPVFLEKKFRLRFNSVILTGSIDRLDVDSDGRYEIIDYKTGKSKEESAVAKNEQLAIYGLAAVEELNIYPESLALYFVEDNIKVATERTKESLINLRTELSDRIEEIKKSDFPARVGKLCQYCEYRQICPAFKIGSNL